MLFSETNVILSVNNDNFKQKINDALGNYFTTYDMYSCNSKFDVSIQSNILDAFESIPLNIKNVIFITGWTELVLDAHKWNNLCIQIIDLSKRNKDELYSHMYPNVYKYCYLHNVDSLCHIMKNCIDNLTTTINSDNKSATIINSDDDSFYKTKLYEIKYMMSEGDILNARDTIRGVISNILAESKPDYKLISIYNQIFDIYTYLNKDISYIEEFEMKCIKGCVHDIFIPAYCNVRISYEDNVIHGLMIMLYNVGQIGYVYPVSTVSYNDIFFNFKNIEIGDSRDIRYKSLFIPTEYKSPIERITALIMTNNIYGVYDRNIYIYAEAIGYMICEYYPKDTKYVDKITELLQIFATLYYNKFGYCIDSFFKNLIDGVNGSSSMGSVFVVGCILMILKKEDITKYTKYYNRIYDKELTDENFICVMWGRLCRQFIIFSYIADIIKLTDYDIWRGDMVKFEISELNNISIELPESVINYTEQVINSGLLQIFKMFYDFNNIINKHRYSMSDNYMKLIVYMTTWECILFGDSCGKIRDKMYLDSHIKSLVKNVNIPVLSI
jgi:hypothetical protein